MHYITSVIYNSTTDRNRDYDVWPINNRKLQDPDGLEVYITTINMYYLLNTSLTYTYYTREIQKCQKAYRWLIHRWTISELYQYLPTSACYGTVQKTSRIWHKRIMIFKSSSRYSGYLKDGLLMGYIIMIFETTVMHILQTLLWYLTGFAENSRSCCHWGNGFWGQWDCCRRIVGRT